MTKENVKSGYLLGIDTGSSKTHAMLTDLFGNVLGLGEAGCGNYESIGEVRFADAMRTAVNGALMAASVDKTEIAGMGLGICGYDWPSEEPLMVRAIDSLDIPCPYQFVNDVTIGLIAGTSQGWGVAVDAGTGNNVRGRDETGKIGRITGNSMRFGEFGGAAEMVWRAMVAVTYAWTQRSQPTKLTERFMTFAGLDSEEALIEGLAMEQIHLPATLAKDIILLAESGDAGAKAVVDFSAQELALSVNAVIRQLDLQECEVEIVLIGSVFNAGEIYLQPFREVIHGFAPRAKLVMLNAPPVVGAVLLAAETIGLDPSLIRSGLLKSAQQRFS